MFALSRLLLGALDPILPSSWSLASFPCTAALKKDYEIEDGNSNHMGKRNSTKTQLCLVNITFKYMYVTLLHSSFLLCPSAKCKQERKEYSRYREGMGEGVATDWEHCCKCPCCSSTINIAWQCLQSAWRDQPTENGLYMWSCVLRTC